MDGAHHRGLTRLDALTADHLGAQQLELMKRQVLIEELQAENTALRLQMQQLRAALTPQPPPQTPDRPLE